MRQKAKTDSNHAAVMKALRDIGASVQSLHMVGKGVPDLLVGYHGKNILLEVKDGSRPPSGRLLTKDEFDWHATWGGQVGVVVDPEAAQRLVIALCLGESRG